MDHKLEQKEITVYYKPKPEENKRHVRNYILFISITAVIVYTVAAFILQFVGNGEISATLTTCFYSFFGVEILTLASITKHKNKIAAQTAKDETERGGNYGRGI